MNERIETLVENVLEEQGISRDYEKGFLLLKDAILLTIQDSSLTKKQRNKEDSIFGLLAKDRGMNYAAVLRATQVALLRLEKKQTVLEFIVNSRLEVLKRL